jgi:drug/metabolite transporter (DMT)-like permease
MPARGETVRGIALMVVSAALLALNDTVTKWLTESYPATQVWCLRTVFVLIPILAVAAHRGAWRQLRVVSWGGQTLRAALFVSTTLLIVLSLEALPLPDVMAIVLASPLFVAALSMRILGERVSAERWAMVAVGFVGVVLIVRPTGAFHWIALVPVAASLSSALRDMVTRRVSRTETSLAILFYSSIAVIVIGLATAPLFEWRAVSASAWALLALNGALNGGAHFLMIESLRLGEAATVVPFKYSGLLWGLLLGFLVWRYIPDTWMLVGAALVAGSGLYLLRLEYRPTTVGRESRDD